jgi:hypothetical protein
VCQPFTENREVEEEWGMPILGVSVVTADLVKLIASVKNLGKMCLSSENEVE